MNHRIVSQVINQSDYQSFRDLADSLNGLEIEHIAEEYNGDQWSEK